MSVENFVLYQVENQVATITLNRANRRNAFDEKIIDLLLRYFHTISQDPNIRIVVLKGAGDHFSAGADLNWMQKMINYNELENKKDAEQLSKLMQQLYHLNKPTLCLTQGAAIGGALGLIACCDIILAEKNAIFAFSEVKLGLAPAVISPYVIEAIGTKAAKYWMLTGNTFTAHQAKKMGLITEVVDSGELAVHARKIIQCLKNHPPQAIQSIKHLVNDLHPDFLYTSETKEKLIQLIADRRVSVEGQEGILAFLEKRKPNWPD